jgi:catechol 2,3-dioxygenase-like lactoylglutathione lyase family enzyme
VSLARLGFSPAYVDGDAVGFGNDDHAPFWILPAERGADRELHLAFSAADREVVARFHRAALTVATEVLHEPRRFPEYGPDYFACFVRDPDGHNIEAVCRQR